MPSLLVRSRSLVRLSRALVVATAKCIQRCCGSTGQQYWTLIACDHLCGQTEYQQAYIRTDSRCAEDGTLITPAMVLNINGRCYAIAPLPTSKPDPQWPIYPGPTFRCVPNVQGEKECDSAECQAPQYIKGIPCRPNSCVDPNTTYWVCDTGRCGWEQLCETCFQFDPATSPRVDVIPPGGILLSGVVYGLRSCCECDLLCSTQTQNNTSPLCPSLPAVPMTCCCGSETKCYYVEYRAYFESFDTGSHPGIPSAIKLFSAGGRTCKDANGFIPPVPLQITTKIWNGTSYDVTYETQQAEGNFGCFPYGIFLRSDCPDADACGDPIPGQVSHQWHESRNCNTYSGQYQQVCGNRPPGQEISGDRIAQESYFLSVEFEPGPCADSMCNGAEPPRLPPDFPVLPPGGGGQPSPLLSRNLSPIRQTTDRTFGAFL